MRVGTGAYVEDALNAVVGNWMRNRNTIEYLGIWEALNNPNFNPLEFEGFRSQAGLNAFPLSPSRWREAYANEADVLNVAFSYPTNDCVRKRRKQTYIESKKTEPGLTSPTA